MLGTIAVNLAILGVSYAYHRWQASKNKPPTPKPASEIQVPRTDDGAPIPIIYGKCRVREPWLAWASEPASEANDPEGDDYGHGSPFVYRMNMLYVVGIPFRNGTNRVHEVFIDDAKLRGTLGIGTVGPNEEEVVDNVGGTWELGTGFIGQFGAYYDGNDSQLMCNLTTPFAGVTQAGVDMGAEIFGGQYVAGFRGFLSMYLYATGGWYIGNNPRPGLYSFEASSYPASGLASSPTIGVEANPADVVFDLLRERFGKLGIPTANIDIPSFQAAAATLLLEGHGYSRAIEGGGTAEDIVGDILEQVDGVIRENPTTDKIEIKLVRPDYDPNATIILDPSNSELIEYEAANWENVFNKIRVIYTDRSNNYQEASVTAHNQANATAQLGQSDELVLRMLGAHTEELAQTIADREANIRSRPLARCSMRCDRRVIRQSVGDVVRVTLPKLGVSRKLFRVAHARRGTLQDNAITLDLIEEPYIISRGILDTPEAPGVPAHR